MSIVSNDYINKTIPRLPIELRRYIYGYIYDEVKVFYWLDKYKWDNQLDTLFQFYEESSILEKYYENIPHIPRELLHKHCYHDIDKVVINGVRHKYTWWDFVYNDEYNLSKDIVEDIMKNINEGRIYEIYKVLAMFIHAYNSIE